MSGAAFAVELDRAKRALAAAEVEAEFTAEARLGDAAREAVLAMALREAVTNVIRHSGARRCKIALDAGPDGALRLSIEDDGRGGEILEGSGLRGMRIRLMAAGGDLQIRSDGAGARLLASLPAVA
jgi:two-component system sensor histidine kinase DesK